MKTQRTPGVPSIVWLYVIAAVLLLGCAGVALDGPSDVQAEADTAASLRDALRQAQADQPGQWTPAQIERAQRAAPIAARHLVAQGQPGNPGAEVRP